MRKMVCVNAKNGFFLCGAEVSRFDDYTMPIMDRDGFFGLIASICEAASFRSEVPLSARRGRDQRFIRSVPPEMRARMMTEVP